MNLFAIGAFINGILIAFFGAFVYFKNRKKTENQVFGALSLSLMVWAISFGFWQMAVDKTTAFLFVYLLMIGAIFIPIFYLHYIFVLLNLIQEKKKFLIGGYLITLIFLLFNFTPYIVKDLSPALYFPYWPEGGVMFHFWLLWFLVGISYGLCLLLIKLKEYKGIKREQIKYVILATLIAFGGGLTIFPLWYGILFPPVGIFVIFLYPLILSYAILRYRFMDIRFALSGGVVYISSLAVIIGLAFLLMFLWNQFAVIIPFNIAVPLILIIGILLFQPTLRFFEDLASRYFYYTFYSYQKVLTDLGKNLTRILDLDKLSSLIIDTLTETMKLDRTVVLLRDPETGSYQIQKNIGFHEENGISLVKDNFLTQYLEKSQKPLVYEEISLIIRDSDKDEEKEKLEILKENMKRIEASLCLPLIIKEKIIGMIVLGNKISGDAYSQQDIELLTNLSSQSSIALQNARLYSQIQDLSENLEEKVKEQTKELQIAYQELKVLDKAKSEFISMASHQLRTPSTAIKGYISMLIEGSYGELPAKAKEKMELVFHSNERMIKIVNDLLNISKIELGKIEIEKGLIQIEELIQSCCEELIIGAEKKELKLVFKEPKVPLPKLNIDSSKIKQVISNLIDNAIKYTQKGEVEINLEKNNSSILISIKDTGEGLTEEEKKRIFEGFTRGKAGIAHWVEGTGLGLYVARKFLNLHNGRIWAESPGLGKGSTFFIELPLRAPDS